MNSIKSARKLIAFLETKNIDDLSNLTVGFSGNHISITTYRENLSDDEYRMLKRVFGPLKITDSYSGKNHEGSVKLDNDSKINLTIYNVFSCRTPETEEVQNWTEAQWDVFKEHAKEGKVKVSECTTVESIED